MKKIATFIVDKRNLVFLLAAIALIFSVFSRNWVKVEDNLTFYLPPSSGTRQALDIMEDQFTTFGSAKVMLANITQDDAARIAEDMESIKGVDSVAYDETTEHYNNVSALFSVSFAYPEEDPRCLDSLEMIKARYGNYDMYIATDLGNSVKEIINQEVSVIMVLVAIIVVAVLIFTSETWAEVPVLLVTFVMAMLLNQGSNFLLGKISFVSNSVTSILQLALSLDYAIILCNRFKEERRIHPVREAAIEALSKGIPEIGSSSLTTIGGLVAMVFMQFRIGSDMAICLIKAIVFALMSVFLLMPGLLVLMGPLIDKTGHRVFVPKVPFIGRFAYATRKIVPIFFILLVAGGFYFSRQCPYVYGYSHITTPKLNDVQIAEKMIEDNFDSPEMLAVIVPAGDYDTEKALMDNLESKPQVRYTQGLANTEALGGYMLTDKLNPRQFSELADLDYEVVEALYAAYATEHEDYGRLVAGISSYYVPLVDIFLFACDKVEEGYVTVDDDTQAMLDSASVAMRNGLLQLQGTDYSRFLVFIDIPEGGEALYSFIEEIKVIAEEYYDDAPVFVAGNPTSEYDFKLSFDRDNITVSIISILVVLVVLLFTFNSVGMPLLLIVAIQGCIWLNFAIPAFTKTNIFFMSYLIVSAIQMGANIDYAIVIASRFMELKDEMPAKEAIIETMNYAFPTIITSGTILAVSGILIGSMTSEGCIVGIGQCIGRGTIISMILVMFVLPQILLVGSRVIDKTSFKTVKLIAGAVVIAALISSPAGRQTVYAAVNSTEAAASSEDGEAPDEDAQIQYQTVHIYSVRDLKAMAAGCTYDSWSAHKHFLLESDLELTDEETVPIPVFAGIFDGQGHTISGVQISGEYAPAGFFAVLTDTAQVSNLYLEGTVNPSGSGVYAGGIAGRNYGTITESGFKGTIEGKAFTGGIAGANEESGVITDCSFSGMVTGRSMTGGLAGVNHGVLARSSNNGKVNTTSTDPMISLNGLSLDMSSAISHLTSSDTYNLVVDSGGIAGFSDGIISQCLNYGTIGYEHIGYNVGGIAGRSSGYINSCLNRGLIYGRKDVGGIAGMAEPCIFIDEGEDYSEKLKAESDRMNALLENTIANTRMSADTLSRRLEALNKELSSASESARYLSYGMSDFLDDNINEANRGSENIHKGVVAMDKTAGELDSASRHVSDSASLIEEGKYSDAVNELTKATDNMVQAGEYTTQYTEYMSGQEAIQLTESGPTNVSNAADFFDSIQRVSDQLTMLNTEANAAANLFLNDASGVTQQGQVISDSVSEEVETIENAELGDRVKDTSEEDIDSITAGKVEACINLGDVNGDIDAGGIAGSMANYNAYDPEMDSAETLGSAIRREYELKAILISCTNRGRIETRKNYAGSICGLADLGLITGCYGYGSVVSTGGSFVGGIAGCGKSVIRSSYAKCRLSGDSFIGGITGSGTIDETKASEASVSDCISMVYIDTLTEHMGAVAGYDPGNCENCIFVSDILAGINGASYAGIAEPVSYKELIAIENIPADYQSFSVYFVADDKTILTKYIRYGDSVPESDYPEIPEKEGCNAQWDNYDLRNLKFDTIVTAVYSDYVKALGSSQIRGSGRRTFLLEGDFGDDYGYTAEPCVVEFNAMPKSLPDKIKAYHREMAEQWHLSFEDEGPHTIRYLPPDTGVLIPSLYVKSGDGPWQRADYETFGSYMKFEAEGKEIYITLLTARTIWWIWIVAAVTTAILLIIVIILRKMKWWLVPIAAAAGLGVAAIAFTLHFVPDIGDSLRIYRIADSYLEKDELDMKLRAEITRDGETTVYDGDAFMTQVSGRRVVCCSFGEDKAYITVGKLIEGDGTVKRIDSGTLNITTMNSRLYNLFATGKVTSSEENGIKTFRFEDDPMTLELHILSDSIESMDMWFANGLGAELEADGGAYIHITFSGETAGSHEIPRNIRAIIAAD